jgi:hypothetical protein
MRPKRIFAWLLQPYCMTYGEAQFMELDNGSGSKKQMNLLILSVCLSMAFFVLLAMVLLLSVSGLKKENKELLHKITSLQNEYETIQESWNTQNNNTGIVSDQMMAELQDVKAQLNAIVDLHGGVQWLQSPLSGPDFTISSFSLAFFDNADFKYQSYAGTGTVSTVDKQDSFLVLLKKTLKSGGAATTKKVEHIPILVVNGTGAFYTDDSMEGTVVKPDYEFSIIGYIRISSIESVNKSE